VSIDTYVQSNSARASVVMLLMQHPQESEWSLLVGREPTLGTHIVASRRGYLHHGIYVGGGCVVHYPGLSRGLRSGPVEEISLAGFACGQSLWVRFNTPNRFAGSEVIRRARSRVGEGGYRLLSNNCEHFCEWCLCGEHRSYQVEALLAQPVRVLHAAIRLVSRLMTLIMERDQRFGVKMSRES
jgi:hypothetical protein